MLATLLIAGCATSSSSASLTPDDSAARLLRCPAAVGRGGRPDTHRRRVWWHDPGRGTVVAGPGLLRGLRSQLPGLGWRWHRRPARPDRAPRLPERRRPVDDRRPGRHRHLADADRRVAELSRLRRHRLQGHRGGLRHDRGLRGVRGRRARARHRGDRRPGPQPHLGRAPLVRGGQDPRLGTRQLVRVVRHRAGCDQARWRPRLASGRVALLLQLLLGRHGRPEPRQPGGHGRARRRSPAIGWRTSASTASGWTRSSISSSRAPPSRSCPRRTPGSRATRTASRPTSRMRCSSARSTRTRRSRPGTSPTTST